MKTPEKKRDPADSKTFNTAYFALRPFWNDVLQLKEPEVISGIPGIAQYLHRYAKEDQIEFLERVKRLAQVNFLDLALDTYQAMLFSTNIQIKSEKYQDRVDRFVNSCNQQGDSLLDYFAETVVPASLAFGVVDVMVDLPAISDDVVSVAQLEAVGANDPYVFVIMPLNRVYWRLDDAGNYIEYQSQDIIDTQLNTRLQIKDRNQYTLWTVDEVVVYDGRGGEIDRKPNPYGLIPAVTVIPRYPLRYHKDRIGISLVQDVVPLQKMVINLISLIMDFHENVNFAMRVLVQDTSNGDEPPTEGELSEGGNKRGIILRGKDSDMKILGPDPAGVESMRCFLAEIIERIYQSLSLPSDPNLNKTHQTGQTVRSNQAVLFNKLSKLTKHFERSLKQIVEMALRVQGIDPKDAGVTVQWDRNFSYEAFITNLQQFQMLRQTIQDMSPTAASEYGKSIVAPQLYSTGKMPDIEKEMDKWVKKVLADPSLVDPNAGSADVSIEASNQQVTATDKVARSDLD